MFNISIIGTANREQRDNMDRDLFSRMCYKAEEIINSFNIDLKTIKNLSCNYNNYCNLKGKVLF